LGWRFRRRLRVMPGVYLNLGKRGASVSLGVRGAHVTFGQRGKRATIGLPGSGISYTAYEPYRSPPRAAQDPALSRGTTVPAPADPAGSQLRQWYSRPSPAALLLAILLGLGLIAFAVAASR
jgi:hypothetical protein